MKLRDAAVFFLNLGVMLGMFWSMGGDEGISDTQFLCAFIWGALVAILFAIREQPQ